MNAEPPPSREDEQNERERFYKECIFLRKKTALVRTEILATLERTNGKIFLQKEAKDSRWRESKQAQLVTLCTMNITALGKSVVSIALRFLST